jgi:sorting nexin-29
MYIGVYHAQGTRRNYRIIRDKCCHGFNIALEEFIRDSAINLRGTIFYRSVQILAFAYDSDIRGRTQKAMKEAFTNLEKAARKMHLQINQGKTKYMPVTKKIYTDGPTYLEIGPYKFETVYSFTYLGSEVNYKNGISVDIQKRILSANRCFHGLRKHLKSHLISRKTKTFMHKVLVRPVLTYASETWTLSKTDERLLSAFE